MRRPRLSSARDMTRGSIVKQIILFALPLMLGNVFQMLYNTVDSIVVGNFVGKEALAAVGSTTMIVNMLVFFFNGFSVGAGVIIAQHFGARDLQRLHTAVETTMTVTLVFCALFTAIGVAGVRPMLRLMSTPEDVLDDATTYLTIYFWGISGLLIYNIGSGILRAVGDTTRPLIFLALTSLLNIVLDLTFVIGLHAGIAGVAYATILSQFVSAGLILALLTRTHDIYRLSWRDLGINPSVLRRIFAVGLPAGIQSVITAFSNIFVQSYVNFFGSSVMAGWASYNKLDQFIMLPIQSTAMAATTFVSQNIGAGQEARANQGTKITIALSVALTGSIALLLMLFAPSAVRLFSKDEQVIRYGSLFIRSNSLFLMANCVNHTLAGSLRGRCDSRGPMIIMLLCFVAIRQTYLFLVTRFVANTPFWVGFGYPVGWMTCCALESLYFLRQVQKRRLTAAAEA
ncbi:MAG: MATE family efflux transporter [Clostridia bacterium]|nr:MATE family efflux transporter [Clostridia bacterium]